jgi:hypothetical protein
MAWGLIKFQLLHSPTTIAYQANLINMETDDTLDSVINF